LHSQTLTFIDNVLIFEFYILLEEKQTVFVSLTQLVWTMHKICKVRGSNPDHHQKRGKTDIHVPVFPLFVDATKSPSTPSIRLDSIHP